MKDILQNSAYSAEINLDILHFSCSVCRLSIAFLGICFRSMKGGNHLRFYSRRELLFVAGMTGLLLKSSVRAGNLS